MENRDYVSMYRWILIVFAFLFFVGGIFLGLENISIMFSCWIGGTIFLVFMNMIKDILEELRKISAIINNNNLKEEQETYETENDELENDNQLKELLNKLEK